MSNPISVKIDNREVLAALKKGRLNEGDMLSIEKPMALHIVNNQRTVVPKDTHATELSIGQHIQESSAVRVVDHVGPETDYSPWIEFGVASKPNYPIQPFVRPSIKNTSVISRIGSLAFKKVIMRKHGRT